MSIVTKKGDAGTTALMYGRRVSKCDARVEAYGSVDELNAALGLARSQTAGAKLRERLLAVQQDLVVLMGELATHPEDLPRYEQEGYHRMEAERTRALDRWLAEVEGAQVSPHGWAMPGASSASAALDLARTVCRRAERRVVELQESDRLDNDEIIVYLNRLGDLLWLLARWIEHAKA